MKQDWFRFKTLMGSSWISARLIRSINANLFLHVLCKLIWYRVVIYQSYSRILGIGNNILIEAQQYTWWWKIQTVVQVYLILLFENSECGKKDKKKRIKGKERNKQTWKLNRIADVNSRSVRSFHNVRLLLVSRPSFVAIGWKIEFFLTDVIKSVRQIIDLHIYKYNK